MGTSKLQRLVSSTLNEHFRSLEIRENTRPDWCISERGERLELDFYFPKIDVAIEVQGGQHFTYTPIFHATYQDFQAQQQRDESKKELCQRYGVLLLELENEDELPDLITRIREIQGKGLEKRRVGLNSTTLLRLTQKAIALEKQTRTIINRKTELPIHDYRFHVFRQKASYEAVFAEYGQEIISYLKEGIGNRLLSDYRLLSNQAQYAENKWQKHLQHKARLRSFHKNGGTS